MSLIDMGFHSALHTSAETSVTEQLCQAFSNASVPLLRRLQTFPRHVRRQDVARFLAKYELFKLAIPVHGNVIECGVYAGGGLFSWHQFSAILEPYNHSRRIIGFDTFSGFPTVHDQDTQHGSSEHLHEGAFRPPENMKEELTQLAKIHDRNRPLGHIPKLELVEGDACKTIPEYVKANPHLLVSLIYLDFDLYEPTKAALEHLYPRIVKGGVVAFDELNCKDFPGETAAVTEMLGAGNIELRRFPLDPYMSYFIKA